MSEIISKENSGMSAMREKPFDVVVIRDADDEQILEDILRLEKQCYPDGWQYPDAKEYYGDMLKRESSIHIFLREGNEAAGYLLGRPLSEAYNDLREYDPELHDDSTCFYLETIGVDPKFAGRRCGMQLLEAFRKEVLNRKGGYERISAHARKAIGSDLSGLIRKTYADVSVRSLPEWHFGGNEPYDYVVWKVAVSPNVR